MKKQYRHEFLPIAANSSFRGFLIICACLMFVYSCQKDMRLPRSMMVIHGNIQLIGGTNKDTSVTLYWPEAMYSKNKTISYTVEVSTDPTFQTMPKDSSFSVVVQNTDSVSFGGAQLIPFVEYYARVKADSAGLSTKSAWVQSPKFLIGELNLLKNVKYSEITDSAAIIRWTSNSKVTGLTITDSASGSSKEITLTSTDLKNAYKIVTGLQPNTTYAIQLYNAKIRLGHVTFKTMPAITGNIIDLTSVTNRPNLLTDTLSQVPSGSIILLGRGQTYTVGATFAFGNSVSIMSKPGFGDAAYIQLQGYSPFDFVNGSQIDSIVFKNVKITGDYSSNYVMNISTATTVGKIVLEGCNLLGFRGVVRIKNSNPVNIASFILDNCVVDSVNSYGVLNVGNSSAHVQNIQFTNSTIVDANVIIASKTTSESLTISNCTFYESPGQGRYLFDYGSKDITNPVQVLNCLFGKADGAQGYRAGSNTKANVSNSFATSDYSSGVVSGVASYQGSSTQLFTDPANGDFTILDNTLVNVGDPRWQP
jgi:hypothetical protein